MSRNPAAVVVSLVIGLFVGFGACHLIQSKQERLRVRSAQQDATQAREESVGFEALAKKAREERNAAKAALEKAEADLAAAQAEVARLDRAAAVGGHAVGEEGDGQKASLSDQEKQARIAELVRAIENAQESKDGKALLEALQALVALGEPAFPRVVEGLGILFEDMFGENTLKLAMTDVFMSISGKDWTAYYKWTLATPTVDPEARKGSVEALIWSQDPEVAKFLALQLATEKDRAVAKAILDNLAYKDPEAKTAIRGVLETRLDDKQIRMDAVNALWSIADQSSMDALTRAAQADPDPDVREAARIASRGIDPPVAGYMVNYVDSSHPAGLQRGDIVLAYNGKPISSTDTLGKESRGTEGTASVPIQIYRNGEVVNATVKGGSIDVWGRYVKPKK